MATILITGANRGIGLELTRQALEQSHSVIATARKPDEAAELKALAEDNGQLDIRELDVADSHSVSDFVDHLGRTPVDVFINNAGIYGQRDASLGSVDGQAWQQAFLINTIAPLLLTQKLMPVLREGKDRKLAYISSKMGSIDDNTSGGSYVYRSTKTALNQVVRSLAQDLAGEGFIALALHPGWVRTDMGGPNGLIDAPTSAEGLLNVIHRAGPAQSGQFLNYDGKTIAW